MTVLCQPARIAGVQAAWHFTRPRVRNLFGLLVKQIQIADAERPETRTPPFLERLWMPSYAIGFRATVKQRTGCIWTSVDAWSGFTTIFERTDELFECALGEEYFPPKLAEAKAIELARHGLIQFTLRQRGQRHKPTIESIEAIRLYHFPVWALYYRRFGRYLDLKVLDAYTGNPAGARTRVGLLNALVAAKKARTAKEPGPLSAPQ